MNTATQPLTTRAIWRFSRPHAFLGTAASIISLWLIAANEAGFSLHALTVLTVSLLFCLSAALFIVGLNQFFDVAIDRINKPRLPMASGELSRSQALGLLIVAGGLAGLGAGISGFYLRWTILLSLLLGTAYSAPPLRWKRHPLPAAICIVVVRGPVINFGLYLHFISELGGPARIIPVVWVLCALASLMGACIAACKDIPDVEGDEGHGQRTLAQMIGQRRVFQLVSVALIVTFLGTLAAIPFIFRRAVLVVMLAIQIAIMALLWSRGRSVDAEQRESITPFYMLVWSVFQYEYLLFAAACLLDRAQGGPP